ncbi:LptA/OstA family protein [Thalassobaculum sp. OXR-137]|uniref:LptA/OstA family protein n=1 Tax=Thalassobaculum sp. OXR-137 TaxID=3100173 RepID=UPI002AC97E6B|nr:LptA/OstA family protein [Thalassobaculum sp. OXR-137]WPZ36165.1 LptA/OstA family protein [Thalassobaculum sp. OXR-137]
MMARLAALLATVLILVLGVVGSPVRAQLLQQEGDDPVTIEADDGIEWVRDDKLYIARGNAKAVRGTLTVSADTLTAAYRAKDSGGSEVYKLEARGNVQIVSTDDRAVGDHAVYDIDKEVIVLVGDNLSFKSGVDTITARDSLEYWETRRLAVARGDASAWREGQRIDADVLTAHFGDGPNGENRIEQVDALGNVVITTPEEVVHGKEGVYDVLREVATLEGDVRVTRGENQLNGERAVVNLKTGVSRMLPGSKSGERVKGLFTPEREKN